MSSSCQIVSCVTATTQTEKRAAALAAEVTQRISVDLEQMLRTAAMQGESLDARIALTCKTNLDRLAHLKEPLRMRVELAVDVEYEE